MLLLLHPGLIYQFLICLSLFGFRYTDRRKSAIHHFKQALSIDPLFWAAYEQLCILGMVIEHPHNSVPLAVLCNQLVVHIKCCSST
jgi:anaphase-promoting complex subunit 3